MQNIPFFVVIFFNCCRNIFSVLYPYCKLRRSSQLAIGVHFFMNPCSVLTGINMFVPCFAPASSTAPCCPLPQPRQPRCNSAPVPANGFGGIYRNTVCHLVHQTYSKHARTHTHTHTHTHTLTHLLPCQSLQSNSSLKITLCISKAEPSHCL